MNSKIPLLLIILGIPELLLSWFISVPAIYVFFLYSKAQNSLSGFNYEYFILFIIAPIPLLYGIKLMNQQRKNILLTQRQKKKATIILVLIILISAATFLFFPDIQHK